MNLYLQEEILDFYPLIHFITPPFKQLLTQISFHVCNRFKSFPDKNENDPLLGTWLNNNLRFLSSIELTRIADSRLLKIIRVGANENEN